MSTLFRGERYYWTAFAISGVALLLIYAHAISRLTIDLTTVALLLILISPWLFPFVKQVSFPGGGGIVTRDVEALEKASGEISSRTPLSVRARTRVPQQVGQAYMIVDEDPNLALASIHIALEQTSRDLANKRNMDGKYPVSKLVRLLSSRGVIPDDLIEPMYGINKICNRTLHQADVDRDTARRVIGASESVFQELNRISRGGVSTQANT